ncbi:MAG: translation elongation factor Ts [Planctomycetes bacterium]|nr:translation elongation factor Ts [Planctomycetota bacterium]
MAIDAKMIKELREKTGMGITQCKKALEDCAGDMEKAEILLRKQGLDKAAKKADRPTGQGVIAIRQQENLAAMIELACEQEPTTNNERFVNLVDLILDLCLKEKAKSADELLKVATSEGTIADSIKAVIGVVGENIQLRKAVSIAAPAGGMIGHYAHFNRKAGAMVALSLENIDPKHAGMKTAANDISMHAVAARPLAWNRAGIPHNIIEKEKEVFMEEVNKKPENIRARILEGKLQKFYSDKVLTEQLFVKDPEGKTSVRQMLDNAAKAAGGKAEIVDFTRFELGL